MPFGAHPGGLHAHGVEGIDSYAEDYDFVEEFRDATRDDDELDEWIKHWILDCKDQDDYTRRLGYDKIMFLKGKSQESAWRYEIESKLDALDAGAECNPMERMVVTAARRMAEKYQ